MVYLEQGTSSEKLGSENMGMLRILKIKFSRAITKKAFCIGLIALACVAVLKYVVLQSDEMPQPLSEKRHLGPGGLRFHARSSLRKSNDVLQQNLRHEDTGSDPIFGDPLSVPRVAEYCHIPPAEVELGEEGDVPGGYNLISVAVLIRHGDRTPMHTLLSVPRPQPREGCVMSRSILKKSPELRRFMYDMAVAKDKQPSHSYFAKWSLFPQHKDCGSSQLTGRGALQHLHNGLALREKYVEKWNLFGSKFSPGTQLKVRSTQYSRTYQSAVSFLYTFLPHFDIKELDIQAAADVTFCHSKYVPSSCCTALTKMKQPIDRESSARIRKNPAFTKALAPLAEVFDVKIGHLPYASGIIDNLQGHACHSLRLPCGKNGKCVTASMMKNLWDLVDIDGKGRAEDPKFDVFSRIAVRSLLLEIATDMNEAARNHTDVKFSLYSGHDVTVSPLLQALGMFDGKWPHYATRIVFELYRKGEDRKGENYIRILHSGRDVTSLCRLCRNSLNSDGLCRFSDFLQALLGDTDDITGAESLQSYCQSKK